MVNPEAVAQLRREMRAVGSLDHPHIVRAYDAREVDGTHFLVMEYVEGMDLATLICRIGRLPLAEACEIIRQAAVGLEHVHQNDLVHRDIKPSNLMLSKEGTVKVLDLGLARLHEDLGDEGKLTNDRQLMGTIDYLAPEQAADTHSADIRADVYSLGCTLYNLLTGQPPFPAPRYGSVAEKLVGHARDPVTPVCELRPEVPAALGEFLGRMLAKDRDARPAAPGAVAEAMHPFVRNADLANLLAKTNNDSPSLPLTEEAAAGTAPFVASHASNTTSSHLPQPKARLGRGFFRRPRVLVAAALGALLIFGRGHHCRHRPRHTGNQDRQRRRSGAGRAGRPRGDYRRYQDQPGGHVAFRAV